MGGMGNKTAGSPQAHLAVSPAATAPNLFGTGGTCMKINK